MTKYGWISFIDPLIKRLPFTLNSCCDIIKKGAFTDTVNTPLSFFFIVMFIISRKQIYQQDYSLSISPTHDFPIFILWSLKLYYFPQSSVFAHFLSLPAASLFFCSSASRALASSTVSPSLVRNSSTKEETIPELFYCCPASLAEPRVILSVCGWYLPLEARWVTTETVSPAA